MKKYIIMYKFKLGIIVIFLVIRQLLLVSAQELNAKVFDNLVKYSFNGFIISIITMILVWGIMIGLDAILNFNKEKVILDIEQKIRENISDKIIKSSYQNFKNKSSGNYLSWLNNDVSTISQKGLKQYFNLVNGIAGVIFSSMLLLKYNWILLIITLIGFITMFYIPKIFNKKIYEFSQKATIANEQFVSGIEDELNGYQVYFAFSSLSRFVYKVKYLSEVLKKVLIKQVKLETAIIAVNFSINVFFQILLTFIASIMYFKGMITIGTVTIVGSLADIIFSGLGNISFQISSIKSTKPIFSKFEKIKNEEIDGNIVYSEILFEANNICLKYGNDKIFSNLTFKLYKGEKCLISGLSGSGKSSLLKLLVGYNNVYEGKLLYRGNEISTISSKIIAKEVLYLAQKTHIFNGTVKENIQLGDTYSNKFLISVLNKVGFNNAENLLELDAKKLSGGQIQRLALARALIRNPKVIICDEITSELDKESGKLIENILLNNTNLTVIMITHNLHSEIIKFNKVIEL